ncbi:phosphodiester glycosidase family protein [Lactococcus cremoris]|uniref:phosphodiester glycosidase family protein n=1 Tax=Lactococcus lactis subsp. cremoris TaxID=1359 RepID=UPI002FC7C4DE
MIIIPILIFIAFIGAGAYALRNSLIPTDHTKTNSSDQPTKTSASNGYVEQKGEETAVGSIALVDDAGVSEWVKVPSKVNLDKFTDLSTNNITIYRINNPEVLKTVTNRTDQRMKMSEVIKSYDFGTAIIRDGKIQPSDGSVVGRCYIFIANDKDNNLYAILSDTNAGYDNIMKSVSNLKLHNMLLLDSGGSSQLSVNGKTIVASQDDRSVPDYIVMK